MGDYQKPGNHIFFMPWTEKRIVNPDNRNDVRYVVNDSNGATKAFIERAAARGGEPGKTEALRSIFRRAPDDVNG